MSEKEKKIYDNIEKILMNKIDNKNNSKNSLIDIENKKEEINFEDFSQEIIDLKKSFLEDNPIKSHFEKVMDNDNTEKLNTYKSKKSGNFRHNLRLYNQKIGEYSYNLFDNEINAKKNKSDVLKKYKTSKIKDFYKLIYFIIYLINFFKISY